MRIIPKPAPAEYPDYAEMYIKLLPDDGLVLQYLANNFRAVKDFICELPPEKLIYRPAPEKWTIKEILVHIVDDERIFSYRALRFARNEKQSLPGFDQDDYTKFSGANISEMIVLFGIAGSGKNYVGRIFETEFGFYFYDLDSVLTDAMKAAISSRGEITDEIRDEYINRVIGKMAELKSVYPKLCVAQALFKNKHRRLILDSFPDAKFIWVQAETEIVNLRLVKRAGHSAGKYYAKTINRGFEPPTIPHRILKNNHGRENAANQIKEFLGTFDGNKNLCRTINF